ncbi:myosin-3-like [Anarhichas minor]|uniref:myosin-3-like n=1 Tax=Anarhichas minor TaxID=65739 RepID=UPI003F73C2FD
MEALLLKPDPKQYVWVCQGVTVVDNTDDGEELLLTDEAFDVLGFTLEEKMSVHKLTGGIMHFGNMKFKQKAGEEQADVKSTVFALSGLFRSIFPFISLNLMLADKVAHLMAINSGELQTGQGQGGNGFVKPLLMVARQLKDSWEQEKKIRVEVEKARRKAEGVLKMTMENAKLDLEEVKKKNHASAVESLQAGLAAEAKGRAEAMRMKKKMEGDLNEMEIQLEHANRNNNELVKTLKKLQQQQMKLGDLQVQMDEDPRQHDELREKYGLQERRLCLVQGEMEELRGGLEASERARKLMEQELVDRNQSLTILKRKLDADLARLSSENEELISEFCSADERVNEAVTDTTRLCEELRQEQDRSSQLEKAKKNQEQNLRDLTLRLEEAEQLAQNAGKRTIQKLETRIREVENELDQEQKHHLETVKNLRMGERRLKELVFQTEEHHKTNQHMQELVEKLQNQLKSYKRQIEDAEEQANSSRSKYRKVIRALDDAEERADVAEMTLTKMRMRNRASTSKGVTSVEIDQVTKPAGGGQDK